MHCACRFMLRLPPAHPLSGRPHPPSLCSLVVVLIGEGTANWRPSPIPPLPQFRHPLGSFSSALSQAWSCHGSVRLAVEARPGESPLGLLLRFLTPIVVDAAAMASLMPRQFKPVNLWTPASLTLQLLRRPLARPSSPSVARWTGPASTLMYRFFSWMKRHLIVRSSVANSSSTRTRAQHLSKKCQDGWQSKVQCCRRRQLPKRGMSTRFPTLLQRKMKNLGGAQWSKSNRRSSQRSAQLHRLQPPSGLVLALGSYNFTVFLVLSNFAPAWDNFNVFMVLSITAPAWDNPFDWSCFEMPLRGITMLVVGRPCVGSVILLGMGYFWRVSVHPRGLIPGSECRGLASGDDTT